MRYDARYYLRILRIPNLMAALKATHFPRRSAHAAITIVRNAASLRWEIGRGTTSSTLDIVSKNNRSSIRDKGIDIRTNVASQTFINEYLSNYITFKN